MSFRSLNRPILSVVLLLTGVVIAVWRSPIYGAESPVALASPSIDNPKTAQYDTVSSGSTGHAESVEITFDPSQVSYGQLLQIAFSVVSDPTLLNRQGPDVGTQYRSAVFYADDTQKRIVEAYIAQLDKSHVFSRPIVTRVEPLRGFYPAESYHQDYLVRNPRAPYIAFNDLPKIENFHRVFPELYSGRPVLVSAR
jgi:peptide-methionine (S)-S-oxide reductase